MKELSEDSEPRLSVGSGRKAQRRLARVWEGPSVGMFGEQLGLVAWWVLVWSSGGRFCKFG